ncbi:hypothetical protein OCU04_002216 [Sclerotinia nivalis]|uniref:DUF6590 domain-containing protein n=1 Tax=Sclerotinia nivalis TaxID=352851 RepID=A0A9X0AZN4_9HELO|nr:hypothetical protein OCU04_002216 [Sclerotinia nivalis]
MAHYRSRGKGLDQSTPWSEWAWDKRGYHYSYRTGPTGVQETQYFQPEPENQSATPRTPGASGLNVASNQQSPYSSPIAARNNAYTTTQTRDVSDFDHDATPTPSYTSPAPINHYCNSSNSFGRNYDTLPTTNTFNTARSFQYPSANNATWPAEGVASSSFDATIRGMNSMSLSTPQAVPLNDFESQVPQRLPSDTKQIFREPNTSDTETLDPRYQVNAGLRQDDFWKVGRVFMMLWTEPAQPKVPVNGGTRNGSHFSTTYLGQQAYSEIRRFVVVSKHHGSSICCPIHTYSNQATLKPNLPAPLRHTIIHTTPRAPKEHSYICHNGSLVTEGLELDPIRVISERSDSEGELHELSRLNYSKIYTVEHYVRVLNIGRVARESIDSLLLQSGCSQLSSPASAQRPRPNPPPKKSTGQSSSHHNKYRKHRKDGHY